ncbi:MAG: hypothetical protein ACL7BU_15860 [Candidatus Phlomobacter fragariae]
MLDFDTLNTKQLQFIEGEITSFDSVDSVGIIESEAEKSTVQ